MSKVTKLQATPIKTKTGQSRLAKIGSKSYLILTLIMGCAFLIWHYQNDIGTIPVEKAPISLSFLGDFNILSEPRLREHYYQLTDRSFMRLNVAEVKKHMELLPWVKTAAVRKDWPNYLIIAIREQNPVARWNQDWLLNEDGDKFSAPDYAAELPIIEGPKGYHRELLAKHDSLASIFSSYSLFLDRVRLTERRAWTLVLKNGITLYLGRDNIDERVVRFLAIYNDIQAHLKSRIEYVDLRYDTGIALNMKNNNDSNDNSEESR